ncbi:hypothetical protein OpiT1DRAFT_04429 [Opitutaceae bacterium TAV1]|nr:hypothetical protein OpiT1DRAFT_04429 [Opitutaceae bacterium TAV1]
MKSVFFYSFKATKSANRRAFTIVELLVAVGVTAVLVTLMLMITINVLNTWNRSSGTLNTGNQARLILDQITNDLESAVLKKDDNVWMAVTLLGSSVTTNVDDEDWGTSLKPNATTTDVTVEGTAPNRSLIINATNVGNRRIESYHFGKQGVWLRFFTIPSDKNDPSDLATASAPRAVAYRIVRRDVGGVGSQFSYQLFRAEVHPYSSSTPADTTFGTGFDLFGAGSAYNIKNTETVGHSSNIVTPAVEQLIANDVVDFGVRFWGLDGAGNLTEFFPVDRRVSDTATRYRFAATAAVSVVDPIQDSVDNAGAIPIGYPTVAEVMIRVLTPEGAKLLQAFEEGKLQTSDDWWTIVEKNSQVYTKRIEIKTTGL